VTVADISAMHADFSMKFHITIKQYNIHFIRGIGSGVMGVSKHPSQLRSSAKM